MNLKVRVAVAVVFGGSFVFELVSLASLVMVGQWGSLLAFEQLLLIFGIVVEFCGVLLAAWAYEDRKRIEHLWSTVSDKEKSQQSRNKETDQTTGVDLK